MRFLGLISKPQDNKAGIMDAQRGSRHNVISQLMADNAKHHGDAIWLHCVHSGVQVSWADAYKRATNIARGLIGEGLVRGESVAVAAPNSIGGCLAFLGIVLAGGRATPMNLVSGATVMSYVLGHSKTRFLIVDDGCKDEVQKAIKARINFHDEIAIFDLDKIDGPRLPQADNEATLPELQPTDSALLMYTSGTTGNPKGVVLSHNNMIAAGNNVAIAHDVTYDDSTLCILPIYINAMCVSVMGTIVSASQLVMHKF